MIQKFERFIRSTLLKRALAGRFDAEKALVISSTPRSGSTLLGQVLGAIPHSCTLFEPLHLDNVPEAAAAGFDWRTCKAPDDTWPEGEAYLKRVFRGDVLNSWTIREISYRSGVQADQLLVKFVRANRLYPWLCRHFDLPAPILLMRHPCAVVSSQLKYGWKGEKRPHLPALLKPYPRFLDIINSLQPGEDYMAAAWAFDQLPALIQDKPHPWMIITYEELVLRPEETLKKISSRWQVGINMDLALSRLQTPSSVVQGFNKSMSGVSGWKENLSPDQISKILDTVRAFGITIYSDEIEADYKILNSPELSAAIKKRGLSGASSG